MNQVLTVLGGNNTLTVNVDEVYQLTVASETVVTVSEVSAQLLTVAQQGPPGPNSIGGYAVEVSQLTTGDLLAFSGSIWTNSKQVTLTDGGNF